MTKEEIQFQVALSCIQGVLEAKHGVIGEIVPEIAVKESLRIADEFVKQWFGETTGLNEEDKNYLQLIYKAITCACVDKTIDVQTGCNLRKWLNNKIGYENQNSKN